MFIEILRALIFIVLSGIAAYAYTQNYAIMFYFVMLNYLFYLLVITVINFSSIFATTAKGIWETLLGMSYEQLEATLKKIQKENTLQK